MFDIKKQADYKKMAEMLRELTNAEVATQIMGENHFHFGITKDDIPMMIVCYQDGTLSFAPFRNLSNPTVNDCEYINMSIAPSVDDFCGVLQALKSMVI